MSRRRESARPTACLSVDLDPLWAYQRIHGLTETHHPDQTITTLALQRFADLADHLGLPVTFFLVTSDLDVPSCRTEAARTAAQGHELANHTPDHPYDLLTTPQQTMRRQVLAGQDQIQAVTGRRPVGFRAPGYGMNSQLAHLLEEAGYAYDSSLLPSPPYYAAKAVIMAGMRLTGRRSRAHRHRLATVLGPTTPYAMDLDRPWRKGKGSLLEFPVSVLPGLRIPYIGTTLTLAGPGLAHRITSLAARSRFLTIECHGIDLLDVSDLPAAGKDIAAHQPDLSIPWRTKRFILARAVQVLSQSHEFVTLAQAAAKQGRSASQ